MFLVYVSIFSIVIHGNGVEHDINYFEEDINLISSRRAS